MIVLFGGITKLVSYKHFVLFINLTFNYIPRQYNFTLLGIIIISGKYTRMILLTLSTPWFITKFNVYLLDAPTIKFYTIRLIFVKTPTIVGTLKVPIIF